MDRIADLHLLETSDEELLREVTGLELESSGHALLGEGARVRSTQRLALGDVGSGIVAFTWPAELQPQAQYLYQGDRARRLLVAAGEDGWDVEPRPHLAFWLSSPEVERGYASQEDEPELGSFIARLKRKKRAAHLRPGLRLRCKWSRDEAAALRERGELADEIRAAVNRLLVAVDDRSLRG